MKTETHHIKLPTRSGTVVVTEHPDKVIIDIRFSQVGQLGDLPMLAQWLQPILERFDNDPRPIEMTNPNSNERAIIVGDSQGAVAFVEHPE